MTADGSEGATGVCASGAPLLRVVEALGFAAAAHANQRRKGAAQEPYVNHLIEVAELVAVATYGIDDTAVVAALLHDVVEDTPISAEDLAARFGHEVANLVVELSDDMTVPKHERRRARISGAPHKSPRARLVKTADIISNLRALAKSPPAGWGCDRQLGYLDGCRTLVEAMGEGNAPLAKVYETTAAETERAIRARMDPGHVGAEAVVAELDAAVGQPVHLVYVANTERRPLGEVDTERLCALVARDFSSATIQGADAIFEGVRRPILMVRLRTDSTAAVVTLAQRLCVELNERFVGIETGGRYLRVYSDDTA